jgi:hypothetical protein
MAARALDMACRNGWRQQVAQAVSDSPRALRQLLYAASKGAAAAAAAAGGDDGSTSTAAPFPSATSLQSYALLLLAELLSHGFCVHDILSHPW